MCIRARPKTCISYPTGRPVHAVVVGALLGGGALYHGRIRVVAGEHGWRGGCQGAKLTVPPTPELVIIGFGGLFGESPDRWKTRLQKVSRALVEIRDHFFLCF